ncbi:hypothetical protein VOLCADRAFT_99009 [Volvox carteri f. nagariensis]|uniref:Uncharacterized protein n=1 Tax=Volvox carteri f. nagariensis TaxID=3068 RepID=D8UGT7_VOLCA|nr:uncharacterized protein VOLCADRAFT_99009 [Volvox carteri f. nagariensis]EFJ41037.1 hypothetical protein VOLCADRAFT_99009 [Volvox carteri f. nagariensis]|eukprot:XP_002957901.1 hypothetical protein VOLCADRAFT_99009 [Volvox carteri f. nagariensis]
MKGGIIREEYAMLRGEPQSSSSTWHGVPSNQRGDMETASGRPATALTSTLVSRMEALRQQLLRVSSTLSGVQERAAHLASSMGHRSHTLLYSDGGAAVAHSPSSFRTAVPAPGSDLPTQRYYPPIGYSDVPGRDRPASPYYGNVAVLSGALEGLSYHPFELGSPAGRTMHVALPAQERAGAPGYSGLPYYGLADKTHFGDAEPSYNVTTTPYSTRHLYDRSRDGDGHDYVTANKGHPHDGDDGVRRDRQMYDRSATGVPATTLRPSAAAAAAAATTAAATSAANTRASPTTTTTLTSAFTRQLDSPVLQELLMESPRPLTARSFRDHPAQRPLYREQLSAPAAAETAATAATATLSSSRLGDQRGNRRFSSGATSIESSLDAERVYPWSGGGGGAGGGSVSSSGVPCYVHASGDALDRSSSHGGAAVSVGTADAVRAHNDRRSSLGGRSDLSSIDAARVHPWGGGGDPPSYSLRSADGSLELMSAASFSPLTVYDNDVGVELGHDGGGSGGGGGDGGSREKRPSISGRSVGDGSWLLLSPTVVVREAGGGRGTAVEEVEATEAMAKAVAEGRMPPVCVSVNVSGQHEQDVTDVANTQQQEEEEEENFKDQQGEQRDGDGNAMKKYGGFQDPRQGIVQHNGGDEEGVEKEEEQAGEEEEQEPSVAVSPVSPAPRTPYDADGAGGAGSCSGSGSTTPTPRADLSFAFHSVSFAVRSGSDGDGDADGDGKDWLRRASMYAGDDDDDGDEGDGGDGARNKPTSHRRVHPEALIEALKSRSERQGGGNNAPAPADDDDEVLKTPTHDNTSWGRVKLRYPSASDDAAVSDGDSDAGGGGGGPAAAAGPAATRRRWSISSRRAAPFPYHNAAAATASDGVFPPGGGLYDGYSEEDEEEDHDRVLQRREEKIQSAASVPLASASSVAAAAARAAASDLYQSFSFPMPEATQRSTAALFKAAVIGGSGGGSGSGRSSSSGSSLGGWSQPSPVPSPYTHGVAGLRTPSSGGRATSFSLRKHLDLTVSSCLFADTSSEDEGGEEEGLPNPPQILPANQKPRYRHILRSLLRHVITVF